MSAKAGNSAMFAGRTTTPTTEMAPPGALWLEDSVSRCTLGNVVFPALRWGLTQGWAETCGWRRGREKGEGGEGPFPGR